MSKDLFHEYRNEEIQSLIAMPYDIYLHRVKPLIDENTEGVRLLKHNVPHLRDSFKSNKKWIELEKTIKECKAEQKEIESEIRVNGI